MGEFTPGPWHWRGEQLTGEHFTIARKIEWWNGDREANARLIATAPELYALSERAMRWFADNQCAGELAWEIGAALAKARGEQA